MNRIQLYTIALFAVSCQCVDLTQQSEQLPTIDNLIHKLNNPSQNHVMVAAHRGDWRDYADNSIEGIESCIRMGVDIVEVDVAMTQDGHLILMHDKTVNRTTNGKGKVKDLTLEQIRSLYLKNGLGRASEIFRVPTLGEALDVTKDRILVNLDKSDSYFDHIYLMLKERDMLNQVIIKSDKPYDELIAQYGNIMDEMLFSPVFKTEVVEQSNDMQYFTSAPQNVPAFEVTDFIVEPYDRITDIYKYINKRGAHMWINTLWSSLGGGYTDDKALTDPDGNWGYWIGRGATIIQTDRPQMLIDYLRSKNLRN